MYVSRIYSHRKRITYKMYLQGIIQCLYYMSIMGIFLQQYIRTFRKRIFDCLVSQLLFLGGTYKLKSTPICVCVVVENNFFHIIYSYHGSPQLLPKLPYFPTHPTPYTFLSLPLENIQVRKKSGNKSPNEIVWQKNHKIYKYTIKFVLCWLSSTRHGP